MPGYVSPAVSNPDWIIRAKQVYTQRDAIVSRINVRVRADERGVAGGSKNRFASSFDSAELRVEEAAAPMWPQLLWQRAASEGRVRFFFW